MVGIVDTQESLRISILVALGLQGCAGASPSSSPSGESTSVVTIAPVSSTSVVVEPSDPTDSEIPVISSKIGWVTESNGNAHRATVTTCDPTIDMPACVGTEGHLSCKTDADCTAHPHGKCTTGYGQVGSYCGCTYSCASDSDCEKNEACVCKGVGRVGQGHSVCAKAVCSTDKDCESKQCGLSIYHNGCSGVASLVCRTKNDMCKSDGDCASRGGQCAVARPEPDAKWQCAVRSCVIGRPLVVDGETRAALPTSRADWQAILAFDADSLDQNVRDAVTNHYIDMAAMEHASVASFARFSLQLMALGAPAELLLDAHRAALDEIEHARTSYALAALFGKTSVGPDKLSAAIAPIDASIGAFVKALVLEGCVGETLGAAEGRAAARNVTLREMGQALSNIAEDEERHATLAWRTLKWALETFGESARDAAARGFDEAIHLYSADPFVPLAVESLGILSGKDLGILRRQVLSVVVAPCARALGISFLRADMA
jgi:hypothetical protein